jgi:hypothetical protein
MRRRPSARQADHGIGDPAGNRRAEVDCRQSTDDGRSLYGREIAGSSMALGRCVSCPVRAGQVEDDPRFLSCPA